MDKYEWSQNYLLAQGYNKSDIDKYFHIEDSVISDIMNSLFLSVGNSASKGRKCLTLFGQPGCGKSTYMKNNHLDEYLVIDIDDLRKLYPHREQLIKIIKRNHEMNKNISPENSKGRDFTNFTRKFVGILTDKMIDECIKQGYNIAWQKHASDYKAIEDTLRNLKDNQYEINMVLVLVDAATSWARCQKRNQLNDMVMNTVAKDFHDSYVAKIPQAVTDIAHHYIFEQPYVTELKIVTDSEELVINNKSKFDSEALKTYIYNGLN